jgi:hypothetical protein
MLNTQPLNTAPLNSLTPTPEGAGAVVYDDLMFNGYSLQPGDSSLVTETIESDSAPTRETPSFNTPRYDGGSFLGDYFRQRRVRARGIISAATSALLEVALDEFKQAMTAREGNLDRKQPGTGDVRRIRATLVNTENIFARREGFHITFCPFDLEFLSLEPMWHDIDYTSLTFESVDLAPGYGIAAENVGTYKTQPVIVLIVESATAATGLAFSNTTTDEEISASGLTIAAGDIIVIDSEAKSFTLNGVEVDYDGAFPELASGDNVLSLTATATALVTTATLKYKNAYL